MIAQRPLDLEKWHDFFVTIGTAAGAIVGAAFVVATLTASLERREFGIRGFIAPTAFHLSMVLVACAILTLPVMNTLVFAIVFGIGGIGGLAYSGIVVSRIRGSNLDREDQFWYGLAPILAYLAMTSAAVWMLSATLPALVLFCASQLGLLIAGIHNLWDMATFIVMMSPKSSDDQQPKP